MDKLWVALGAAAPLLVGLGWCIWLLVADARRERRRTQAAVRFAQRYRAERAERDNNGGSAEMLQGGPAVTVPELLEQAVQEGAALRLNWPEEDLDRARPMRPYVQDQFPTAILPKVDDSAEFDGW